MSVLTKHQKAALSIDHHISLTANAGSGKTFVLSKRYLEIALSQNKPNLRNIAAISFTDKAASELYKKIALEIESRIKETKDKNIIWKLESIRRQLVSANISTIHSFCIDILREFPVEAGLDANFTPIDELLSNELIELSVDELIKNSFNNPVDEEKLKYLVRILGSKSILTKELIYLIKKRKNVLVIAENIYSKEIEEVAIHFYESFVKAFNDIFQIRIPQILKIIRDINSCVKNKKPDNQFAIEIDFLLNNYNVSDKIDIQVNNLYKLFEQVLTKSGTVKVRGYLSAEDSENLSNEINVLENFYLLFKNIELDDNHHEIEIELARFGKTAIYFFKKALDLYNSKKKENGYLDYEDILLFSQKILENDDVRQLLSNKYSYIMIDEYQDTNEIQYNIFLPILDYLKKGNLFVVGDEKQSIYMFRDAELEVFNKTKDDIDKTLGENKLLTLPESFRMAPAIELFTNKLFSNLLSNPIPLFNEVNYDELICASDTQTDGKIEVLIEENPENEAELVSARIEKLINSGNSIIDIKYSDIAILCRKRNEFKELENAFVRNKIPFVVVGGKGFYQRQSIYDIYNYFSFLLDKENDTALVGTLRSPFFNLSDTEIFQISLVENKKYWDKLKKRSNEDINLKPIIEQLEENLKLAESYDLTSLLRKLFNETNYLSVIASRSNHKQELANIEKIIKVTTTFYSFGFKTLYDFVNYLKDSISKIEDESQAVVSDESNSVKIMTYHQAKGLEFKAVFLFKSHQPIKKDTIKSKDISINKKYGILAKVPLKNDIWTEYSKAPIVGMADLIEQKKNIAEFKRLFYVGVTRAIDYLFISGCYKEEYKYDSNSIMGLLQEGLGIDFNNNNFPIKSKMKFTRLIDGEYRTEEKQCETIIDIVKKIEEPNKPCVESSDFTGYNYLLNKITDKPEGEFISATKVAVYKQCPLKYQLTYEFGFTKLFNNYKEWERSSNDKNNKDEIFNFNESEILEGERDNNEKSNYSGLSDVKGRIIHKALQEEIRESFLEQYVSERLKNEIDIFEYESDKALQLKNEIIADLSNYYRSKIFSALSAHKNYFNEYEIYVKENDYFLYGIIDKLILGEDKVFIVDYKTDDIDKEEIKERVISYLPQLEFYSYIVRQLLNKNVEIELKLVFLKHPDDIYSRIVKDDDFKRIGFELKDMVDSVRQEKFSKNPDHCSKCLYTLNHKHCIIK